jgi:hypothetical protein
MLSVCTVLRTANEVIRRILYVCYLGRNINVTWNVIKCTSCSPFCLLALHTEAQVFEFFPDAETANLAPATRIYVQNTCSLHVASIQAEDSSRLLTFCHTRDVIIMMTTNCTKQSATGKLQSRSASQEIPIFYVIRKFITVFKKARQ